MLFGAPSKDDPLVHEAVAKLRSQTRAMELLGHPDDEALIAIGAHLCRPGIAQRDGERLVANVFTDAEYPTNGHARQTSAWTVAERTRSLHELITALYPEGRDRDRVLQRLRSWLEAALRLEAPLHDRTPKARAGFLTELDHLVAEVVAPTVSDGDRRTAVGLIAVLFEMDKPAKDEATLRERVRRRAGAYRRRARK